MTTDDGVSMVEPLLGPNRVWAVTPSQHPQAYGVPVFRLCDGSASRETAVTPLTLGLEICDTTDEVLTGFNERPCVFTCSQLDGTDTLPLAVQDNIEAFLTFKRIKAPPEIRDDAQLLPADLDLGILTTPRKDPIAAVHLMTAGDKLGVLAITRRPTSVKLVTTWVAASRFRVDPQAFIGACKGLEHDDFLAGLDTDAADLAFRGVVALLNIDRRALPNQVCAAVLGDLRDRLPVGSLTLQAIRRVLAQMEAADCPAATMGGPGYGDALAALRQMVMVLVKARRSATPARFEAMANLPSWVDLVKAIVDTTVALIAAMEGGPAPPADMVASAVRRVAETAADDFARSMASDVGYFAASLAALAIGPVNACLSDLSIEGRFAISVQLVGDSGWILTRPYEHGLLALVMRGW